MIENLFTATPAEIDGRIAELNGQIEAREDAIVKAERHIEKMAALLVEGDDYAILVAGGRGKIRSDINALEINIPVHYEARNKLSAERAPLTAEYTRRGGWTRFYVVDNNNGHLHTTTACQNTYVTTSWVWMTGMSGMTRDEAVAEGGSLTCLSCFPEFRAEIELGREPRFETPRMKKTREEREAAAAKKAEKIAKATANGITDVDGSPLKDDDGYTIKTLRTAQTKAIQALEQSGLDDIYADQAETESHAAQLIEMSKRERLYAQRLIKAIAAKQDRPLAEVLDEIATKADKKLAPARRDEADRKAAGKTVREWYAAK